MGKMKVAVLGAGNGGQAIAGWLAAKGCDVGITDLFPEYLRPLHRLGKIELSGVVRATGRISVHDDPAECVRGSELIAMVTAAPGHRGMVEKIAPALIDGQILMVNPGYWAHRTIPCYLKQLKRSVSPVYVETESLIYTCRAHAPGQVSISYLKNEMGVGVQPVSETARVLKILNAFYPQMKGCRNGMQVSLDNVNFPLHPAVSLLNGGRIENDTCGWRFYREGTSPSVVRLVEALDAERLALGRAMGLSLTPVHDLLKRFYSVPAAHDLLSLLQLNSAYQDIQAPRTVDYRYFTEDIPYGLVPMVELSRVFGLTTPVMDAVIRLGSVLLGRDLWEKGIRLTDLGFEGMRPGTIRKAVTAP